ncbi:MAG TPA: SdrD B-like domain-containing protein [Patescibacteria group bacterium]|nr:SdrD B-like domain-containing protein [Patescibacteria group bacterium]
MGKVNLLSMKGSLIGIFVTLILILAIPILFLLSQEKALLSSEKTTDPTPTPVRMTFEKGSLQVAGYIYHDTDQDGERKSEEKPFKGVTVQMQQLKEGKGETTALEEQTDTYGYFSFRVPFDNASSYMIKLVLPKGYKTVHANPVILSDLQPNTQNIVEFGLIPSGEAIPSPTKKVTPTKEPPTPTP